MQFQLKKIKSITSFLLLCFFLPPVFAASTGHVYLGILIGAGISKLDHSNPQINYDDGFLTDSYPVYNSRSTRAILAANGGYEFLGSGILPALSLGLGIYGAPKNYAYRGQLIETAYGDPSFPLYYYKFHRDNLRLMIESKFSWKISTIAPYVDLGLGWAWNRLSDYRENPVNATGYVALLPFHANTNNHFTYQIGLGISYLLNCKDLKSDYQQDRISLGYRYVDLGHISFGTRGITYPYSLNFGRLTNNEIYLAYTHFF